MAVAVNVAAKKKFKTPKEIFEEANRMTPEQQAALTTQEKNVRDTTLSFRPIATNAEIAAQQAPLEAAKQKELDIKQKILDRKNQPLGVAPGTPGIAGAAPGQAPSGQAPTAEQLTAEAQRRAVTGNKAQQAISSVIGITPETAAGVSPLKPFSAVVLGFKQAKNMYENIKALSGIVGRDTARVQGLKESYNLAVGSIDKEIGLVATGDMSDIEVTQHIFEAYLDNAQIESFAKQKGIHNLAYWLGEGKVLGALTANNYRDLNILLIKLEKAKAARQIDPLQQELEQAQLDTQRLG